MTNSIALSPEVALATRDLIQISNGFLLPTDSIEASPFQPRTLFDEQKMVELCEDIRVNGVDYPVLVRPIPPKTVNGVSIRFQLVDGERRWRAHGRIERAQIPALVQNLTDTQAQEKALNANLKNESFTDLEEASALKRLWELYESQGIEMSLAALARRLKLLVDFVRNRLAIVGFGDTEAYHPDVQAMAGRNRNVLSAAALINPHTQERRAKYIAIVETPKANGALGSLSDVKRAIEADETEIRLKARSSQAPDAQTQQRQNLNQSGAGGGGAMSRGHLITSANEKNARIEVPRAVLSINRWLPHLSSGDRTAMLAPLLDQLQILDEKDAKKAASG